VQESWYGGKNSSVVWVRTGKTKNRRGAEIRRNIAESDRKEDRWEPCSKAKRNERVRRKGKKGKCQGGRTRLMKAGKKTRGHRQRRKKQNNVRKVKKLRWAARLATKKALGDGQGGKKKTAMLKN